MPFEIGQFVGDYEILGVLGKGGMGQVYRVRNTVSNRVEAMKLILPDADAQSQLTERFMCEIRTLAQLDHPNIAKLNTAFKAENRLVMLMELVDGKTLCDRALDGPIPLPDLLNYADQTLAALSYAHDKGVIHRDIKPSNIMVSTAGTVKLMDFGIAKSSVDPMQTLTGTTVGSTLYMSPEQVRGSTVDHRADIYSLGVLLYEFTAGRRPFEADSMYAILVAQMNTVPEPPVEINPNIPKDLSEIIMTALAKDPAQRFQTAKAFRKALENVREPVPTVTAQAAPVPSLGTQAPAPRPPSSILASQSDKKANRGLWMVLGAVACVCVLIAAAFVLPRFWRSSAASPSTERVQQAAPSAPAQPSVPDSHVASSTPSPKPANVTPPPVVAPVATPATTSAVAATSRPTPTPHRNSSDQMPAQASSPVAQKAAQTPAQIPAQAAPPTAATPPAPSQEDIDKVHDGLTQLHSRAEAVKGSVERLRAQQAADGLGLRQDIAGAAARLDMYLQDADRAADANNLDSARKYMNRAEEELSRLESFFGK